LLLLHNEKIRDVINSVTSKAAQREDKPPHKINPLS
jgi:hypothetical protein